MKYLTYNYWRVRYLRRWLDRNLFPMEQQSRYKIVFAMDDMAWVLRSTDINNWC